MYFQLGLPNQQKDTLDISKFFMVLTSTKKKKKWVLINVRSFSTVFISKTVYI